MVDQYVNLTITNTDLVDYYLYSSSHLKNDKFMAGLVKIVKIFKSYETLMKILSKNFQYWPKQVILSYSVETLDTFTISLGKI